jgi:hypothetical protein
MENSAGQALPVSAVLNGPSITIPCLEEQVIFFAFNGPGCSQAFLADAMVR